MAHTPVGHVVFFSRNDASAIIAIHRGTIPRNAFQSPVQRREKRSWPSEIARQNWFLRYTRPDQAIVEQIKSHRVVRLLVEREGAIKADSVYSNAWNRTSREHEDNVRAFSGKPRRRGEDASAICGVSSINLARERGGSGSSENTVAKRQPFPRAAHLGTSITITIVCCVPANVLNSRPSTEYTQTRFHGLFEGFNYFEQPSGVNYNVVRCFVEL